jgi:co-chaperonin GroES (HSP10)
MIIEAVAKRDIEQGEVVGSTDVDIVSPAPKSTEAQERFFRNLPPLTNTTGINPTEFKVLIAPKPVEEVTKGGIILATQTTDSEKYATIEGTIIAVSHLAFTYATEAEWDDKKPAPGDRVIFAKYAGVRHKAKDGQEYLLVNDKDIVATIEGMIA